MATSIIEKPITHYVIVGESGSGADTFHNKILSLFSAYQSMSNEQRMKSFLYIGNRIYRLQIYDSTFCVFTHSSWGNTNHTHGSDYIIDLISGERKEFTIKSDGTTSVADTTNYTTSANVQLMYWL